MHTVLMNDRTFGMYVGFFGHVSQVPACMSGTSRSVLLLDDPNLALLDLVLGGTLDLGAVGTAAVLQSQAVAMELDVVDAGRYRVSERWQRQGCHRGLT